MVRRKILVIGGVAGGATAAARARRTDETAEIRILEKGPYISFANCGLPYYVGGEIGDRSALLLQTPESFRTLFNVDVAVEHEALAIDPVARTVRVRNRKTGEEYSESYTALILAPGAVPIRPPVPGIDLPNVFVLRTVPDSDALRVYIEKHGVQRAVVVGAGFIGLEMVENLLRRGLAVTLVEKASQVLPVLDSEMAAFVHLALDQAGVEVILGDGLGAFEEQGGRAVAARLESGRRVEGDLFVLGLGVRPDIRLARQAGLAIGHAGGIRVDPYMRTSDPHIYAAGDAVELPNLVTGKPQVIPLAGPANKAGRVAGANAAGDHLTFPGALGTAIVRIGAVTAGMTGLSERNARREGMKIAVSYTTSPHHADYYPGAEPMVIKLVWEAETGRVLGAQAVGGAGVDKRIDVIATAIMGRMTVDDLTNLDLAYAPPFGSAKDPAVVAGMHAQNVRGEQIRVITPREAAEALAAGMPLQVVDLRESYEHAIGALPGAVNIPFSQLRSRIGELDPARPTVVYDGNGQKGYWGARILAQHGFDVRSLTGGYALWEAYEAAAQGIG